MDDLIRKQATLYGYSIEHLVFIARMLQKENITPGTVTSLFMDIQRVVKMIADEQDEQIRKTMENIGEIS